MATENYLLELDATGQKQLLDQKLITSLELVDFYIDRIEKLNPKLNAVIHQMFDNARDMAKNIPLHASPVAGLPFLIKDLNPVKGEPSTSGSVMLKDFIAPANDYIVNRWKEAGLIFLGKTNTPEMGFLPTTEPVLFGPTKNPWDLDRSPGGSSGGAAAAVAAGLIPFAHASDGGGSIRIPASACGLFGFKPSRGRLPYSPYVNHFSVNHALTRSVRDSAILLDILNGCEHPQIYPAFDKQTNFFSSLKKTSQKLRIAVGYETNAMVKYDKATRDNFTRTVQLMKDLGHDVVDISPSFDHEAMAHHFINIWMATGSVVIKHLGQMAGKEPTPPNVEKLTYEMLKYGEKLSALEYEESRVFLQREAQKIMEFFCEFDVWMTPTMNQLPLKIGEREGLELSGYEGMMQNMLDYNPLMPIANATGQPAMSVPAHWTEAGLPVGIHFFGQLGKDASMLQLAHQIENAQPWFHHYKQTHI
ncbi:amidase [Gracilibacillus ureilyticus]|uniref:Amidase n=1 Tax=Gracilibacillus ureilyticus TaxID=531814 RepID=A0A1H9NBM7_9BACI|nr:amidase [Gracilibacillus ureilyticus]SER33450.1 amidase [Gracilibacillus ureilyticus]